MLSSTVAATAAAAGAGGKPGSGSCFTCGVAAVATVSDWGSSTGIGISFSLLIPASAAQQRQPALHGGAPPGSRRLDGRSGRRRRRGQCRLQCMPGKGGALDAHRELAHPREGLELAQIGAAVAVV